jgi:NADH:ubiquinone oxidoreductase subunit 3 (subunit A)
MLTAFATVLAFVGVAAALIVGFRLSGRALRLPSVSEQDTSAESQDAAVGAPRLRTSLAIDARFCLAAVVAVGLEGALAFLVPVAVVLRRWVAQGHGARALVEVLAFVGMVFVGTACAWRKGEPTSPLGAPEKEP